MYLQATGSPSTGSSLQAQLDAWAGIDQEIRDETGPPADYDPATFGETNVYTSPALMWDQLRKRIGDDRFWELVRRVARGPRQPERVVRRDHRMVVGADRRGPSAVLRRLAARRDHPTRGLKGAGHSSSSTTSSRTEPTMADAS